MLTSYIYTNWTLLTDNLLRASTLRYVLHPSFLSVFFVLGKQVSSSTCRLIRSFLSVLCSLAFILKMNAGFFLWIKCEKHEKGFEFGSGQHSAAAQLVGEYHWPVSRFVVKLAVNFETLSLFLSLFVTVLFGLLSIRNLLNVRKIYLKH